jgi:hypothetical protein
MLKSELSFQSGFIGNVFAKGRREGAHHIGGKLDKEGHEEETFTTDASRERPIVYDHVENRFRKVRIQLR